MKTRKLLLKTCGLIAVLLLTAPATAQVGIGTLTPDPSAMLDVTSTTKGLLVPRMTTLERNAITAPAESLLVFDTTEKAFYFYNIATASWIKLANDASAKRNNYKLIKSAADLAPELAAGSSTYLLDANTFYEINGTITLAAPIDLNNAYIAGLDANEDVLSYSGGTIFKGSTGGSIKNLTLTGGKAFEITGPGVASTSTLLVQNTIIANMTTSVGSISGLGLYFGGIIQFVGNTNGITYSNIGNLLLDNQAWLDSNNGTFEKFTGTFSLIEKGSGFSSVNGSDIALDVSTPGLDVGTGVLESTVFKGITSAPEGYVKGYATGSYTGFNFNNAWSVSAAGIPRENDDVATGNLYFENSSVVNINGTTPFKMPVNTKSIRLFRTAEGTGSDSDNRIIYKGETRRPLNIFGTASLTATAGTRLAFSIYKNGSKVTGTEAVVDVIQTNSRQSVTVIGTVDVVKNDYIELYIQKVSAGNEQLLITSYNLIVN